MEQGLQGEKEDQISPEEPVQEEESDEPVYVPGFMRPKEEILTGADRGAAYHKILECLDYRDGDSLEAVKRQIERLYQKGYLTETMKTSVWAGDIYSLVQSPLGRRMKKRRSRSFCTGSSPLCWLYRPVR